MGLEVGPPVGKPFWTRAPADMSLLLEPSGKLVRTLRTVRSATVRINGTESTLDSEIPEAARDILSRLPPAGP